MFLRLLLIVGVCGYPIAGYTNDPCDMEVWENNFESQSSLEIDVDAHGRWAEQGEKRKLQSQRPDYNSELRSWRITVPTVLVESVWLTNLWIEKIQNGEIVMSIPIELPDGEPHVAGVMVPLADPQTYILRVEYEYRIGPICSYVFDLSFET